MTNHQPPKVFLQTRGTTCGVACLMMALDALGISCPLTKKKERELRKALKLNRGYDIVPVVSLAKYAIQQGCSAEIFHENPGKFWHHLDTIDPQLKDEMRRANLRAFRHGVRVDQAIITTDAILTALEDGDLLIIGIFLDSEVTHAVLAHKADGKNVSLIDPLVGQKEISAIELMSQMSIPSGMWYMKLGKKE